MIYGGDGLARLPGDDRGPGKAVFVPFVLPDEEVAATVVEQKPGFSRARLDAVLISSPERIQPACPYFQRCGGCQYQHTRYENQLAIKAEILRETLKRTAKIELPCQLQVHRSPEWNYRNRTRLKVQATPEFALGYFRSRSHDLLPVEQCPISSPLINQAIGALWEIGRAGDVSASVREIELFVNHSDDELLIEAYCAPGTPEKEAVQVCQRLSRLLGGTRGVTAFNQERPGAAADPKKLAQSGDDHLMYEAASFKYRVSAGSFFQVNRFSIDQLIALVVDGGSGKVALDLYAGVGLFSCILARSFAQVIAVEASQTSFADLRHNAHPEVKAVRATTEQFVAKGSGLRPDFVVADPPRGGLGEKIVRNLAGLGSARIAYVSCDPSTLARDLRTFVALGYRIESAHLIDLFPQTFHIESVFHLAR